MVQANSGRLPDFLFIGAMKSATTTMHYQLGQQPGIFMVSNPKELYFFSHDQNYNQGTDWYKSKFSGAKVDEICGEAATTYSQLPTYPDVVERMYSLIPNTKLIYIMRHPIDRLISQYLHECTLKNISLDINRAIYKHPELVDYSRYAMQLEPFMEKFGSEKILPTFFERVTAYPQEEIERICRFIGYPGQPRWDFEAKPKNVTKERPVSTPWLKFLRKSKVLKPIRENLLPQAVKTKVRGLLASNLERPEISPQNLEYLKEIFDRDLARLGQWLGTDMTCDTYKATVESQAFDWAVLDKAI
ncbi:sulfotransferase [Nodosilinea sp. LEGE 07088]|uniref:sulfotransferase family protein n=1 Tax=Nodosilinea sp. LEGE 07088 TaxID=2777968 RepID=UPI00187E9FAB|nr:sulfotransferase [Nodosilinea sp. LEGE 07088]MBE9138216.1 sulfotransferase [Nodosilinea sp. LEGE 07088]